MSQSEQAFDRIAEDRRNSIVLFSIGIVHKKIAIVKLYTRASIKINQKSIIRLRERI